MINKDAPVLPKGLFVPADRVPWRSENLEHVKKEVLDKKIYREPSWRYWMRDGDLLGLLRRINGGVLTQRFV